MELSVVYSVQKETSVFGVFITMRQFTTGHGMPGYTQITLQQDWPPHVCTVTSTVTASGECSRAGGVAKCKYTHMSLKSVYQRGESSLLLRLRLQYLRDIVTLSSFIKNELRLFEDCVF
jgi:hypothetical protein